MRPVKRNATHRDMVTLKLLGEGHHPAEIARITGEAKSSITRRLSRWEGIYVKRLGRSSTTFFELTELGKKARVALRNLVHNATPGALFRYHHLLFRLPVREGLERMRPGFLLGREWRPARMGAIEGFEAELGRVRVFFAGRAFLVFPKPIEGRSLAEVVERGLVLAEKVGARLEGLFGVKLAFKADLCREQMAKRGGITNWIPDGFKFGNEYTRLIVDFSKGEAEIEAHGKYTAEGMSRVMFFLDSVATGEIDLEHFKAFRPVVERPEVQ